MNPLVSLGFPFPQLTWAREGSIANTGVPEEPLHLVVCPVEAFPDGQEAKTERPGGAGKAGVAWKGLAVVAEAPLKQRILRSCP